MEVGDTPCRYRNKGLYKQGTDGRLETRPVVTKTKVCTNREQTVGWRHGLSLQKSLYKQGTDGRLETRPVVTKTKFCTNREQNRLETQPVFLSVPD